MKTRINATRLKSAGFIALLAVSLACFVYLNTVDIQGGLPVQETALVEKINPDNPDVLPDVQWIQKLVRAAFEFMSRTMS